MTDLSEFSPTAQALITALQTEAQTAAAARGAGWAQVHEDRVGGLGPEHPGLEPVPQSFEGNEEGAAAFKTAIDEHAKALQRYERGNRAAIDEIKAAGYAISFSGGDSDRFISLDGVRVTNKR